MVALPFGSGVRKENCWKIERLARELAHQVDGDNLDVLLTNVTTFRTSIASVLDASDDVGPHSRVQEFSWPGNVQHVGVHLKQTRRASWSQ